MTIQGKFKELRIKEDEAYRQNWERKHMYIPCTYMTLMDTLDIGDSMCVCMCVYAQRSVPTDLSK